MSTILLFGAGKSASVLIDYLLNEAGTQNWKLIVADANRKLIEEKTKGHPLAEAVEVNITDDKARKELIKRASIVISMMPPALHILIARDCIEYSKNLLTASYADAEIKALEPQLKEKNILFLCEMGQIGRASCRERV